MNRPINFTLASPLSMRKRIILQDMNSHRYLSAGGNWVSNFQLARVFEHTHSALSEGLRYSDKRPQIVWCFSDDPRMHLHIPIRSEETPSLQSQRVTSS